MRKDARENAEVRPSALVHRGMVEAAGLYFGHGLLGTGEARRRVITQWTPGATASRIPGGLLLRFPAPRFIAADSAPGVPLLPASQGRDAVLLAAPITPGELRSLAAAPGAVVLVSAGVARVVPTGEMAPEDPAEWVDVSGLRVSDTRSLGAPPPPARMMPEVGPVDLRARLPGVPGASPALLAALARLRGERPPPGSRRSWWSRLCDALRWVREGVDDPRIRRESTPRGPGALLRRIAEVWRRATLASGIPAFFGARYAAYLARLVEMFERGDFAEALRHAIPLSRIPGREALFAWLWLPRPRGDLNLSFGVGAAGGIGLGPDIFGYLRALYRRAFDRLVEDGRIDEAAFVLAELLQAHEEAVEFLHKHGRFRLAAELAEGRGLAPDLIVREWFAAGERERAVRIARRTGAFFGAVVRLERANPDAAMELRRVWAASLAESGDYAGAVQALWPVVEDRARAAAWVERAIGAGGVTAGRMLGRKLALMPEAYDDVRARALALLENEDVEEAPSRLAFAEELQGQKTARPAKTLARAAARAVARDMAAGRTPADRAGFRQLVAFTGDSSLRVDVAPLPEVKQPGLRDRKQALVITVPGTDTGTTPVWDSALLPNGRALVALGEAGVRVLARDGRTVVHLDQPAHHLVLSDHGTTAIALASRGETYRLARLDLLNLRAEYWCEARIEAYAPDFDGSLWFVGSEEGLLMIDATGRGLEALWRSREIEGKTIAMARSSANCSIVTQSRRARDLWGRPSAPWEGWWLWSYSLPNPVLRWRRPFEPVEKAHVHLAVSVSPTGRILDHSAPVEGGADHPVTLVEAMAPSRLESGGEVRDQLLVTDEWAGVLARQDGGHEFRLFRGADKRVVGILRLGGTARSPARVAARLHGAQLSLCDSRGRVLVLDLNRGELVRNLRV